MADVVPPISASGGSESKSDPTKPGDGAGQADSKIVVGPGRGSAAARIHTGIHLSWIDQRLLIGMPRALLGLHLHHTRDLDMNLGTSIAHATVAHTVGVSRSDSGHPGEWIHWSIRVHPRELRQQIFNMTLL